MTLSGGRSSGSSGRRTAWNGRWPRCRGTCGPLSASADIRPRFCDDLRAGGPSRRTDEGALLCQLCTSTSGQVLWRAAGFEAQNNHAAFDPARAEHPDLTAGTVRPPIVVVCVHASHLLQSIHLCTCPSLHCTNRMARAVMQHCKPANNPWDVRRRWISSWRAAQWRRSRGRRWAALPAATPTPGAAAAASRRRRASRGCWGDSCRRCGIRLEV